MAGGWKSDFGKTVKQQLSRVNTKVRNMLKVLLPWVTGDVCVCMMCGACVYMKWSFDVGCNYVKYVCVVCTMYCVFQVGGQNREIEQYLN